LSGHAGNPCLRAKMCRGCLGLMDEIDALKRHIKMLIDQTDRSERLHEAERMSLLGARLTPPRRWWQ
jgi:hypothetical protein